MTTTAGSSGVVKVAVDGGSVAQVSEVRSFSFDGTSDVIEDSVMGDSSRTYKAGLKTTTMTLETYWDETDTTGQLVLDEGANIDFEVYPTGMGTGEKYYTGGGLVTGRTISAAFDGMVEASYSVQVSGAVTEATA